MIDIQKSIDVVTTEVIVPTIRVFSYHDSRKVAVIKAIRAIAELPLKQAKDLSEVVPYFDVPVRGVITVEEARHQLKLAGAYL